LATYILKTYDKHGVFVCAFLEQSGFTQCCGLPGTARHTPNPKTAGIVRFPLNAHNLRLDVLCFTNNYRYPSSHLLITNTCFSQSYKVYSVAEITFLKLFTADVFLPATFESSGKWRKFAVPAIIFCATRGSALLYTDKNDDLKLTTFTYFYCTARPAALVDPLSCEIS
jgi:hypothetical protein